MFVENDKNNGRDCKYNEEKNKMKQALVIPIHKVEADLEHCLKSLYVQNLDINEV